MTACIFECACRLRQAPQLKHQSVGLTATLPVREQPEASMQLRRFAGTRVLPGLGFVLLAPGLATAQNESPAPPPPARPTTLSFYVAGHQDDWQLFRGNAAYQDLKSPNVRAVFIYATAGDAGLTDG